MSTTYPTDLPISNIQSVIQTIRDGTINSNRKEFAKSIWLIEGYALGKLIGDTPLAMGSMSPVALTDIQAADLLEQTLPTAYLTSINIPWRDLLVWSTKLLLTLL